MNPAEEAVMRVEIGEVSPQLTVRTRTPMDVGRWWRPGRVWLHVLDDDLVLLAANRRRYVEVIPFSEATESYYNHHAGELVIAPCETMANNRLVMKASEAIQVLRLLGLEA